VNILYIDHGNTVADNYMYQYYGDLYRELKKKATVHLFQDRVHNFETIKESNIDCIIFGLGYFTQTNPDVYKEIKGLKDVGIPVVCMLHKPQTMLQEKLQFCKVNNINILMDTNITYKEYGEITNSVPIRFWFTANPDVFYPSFENKKYDFGFSGASHGGGKIPGPTMNLRDRVHERLEKTKHNVFWNSSKEGDLSYRISSVEEYAKIMRESKIWLATTGPNNDVSPRYFEVMLSKTLLFCNNMPYEYENVFVDGENCVLFENDLSDFDEKLEYYLSNDDARNKIIENAFEIASQKYTWERMAQHLISKIGDS